MPERRLITCDAPQASEQVLRAAQEIPT